MSDSEQTEGEQLTALGSFEPFPFRHGSRRDTNAGWNMVVLQRCRLQYFLFRPILPSLHRPLGALGSNPPHAGTAFGWRCHQPALKGEVDMSVSEWTEGLKKKEASLIYVNPSVGFADSSP